MVPVGSGGAAFSRVEVELEREAERGWSFSVRVRADPASPGTLHEVTMSWVDYEYWCHAQLPPERVVRAVVSALLEAGLSGGAAIPAKFDASTVRRWVRDLDERLAHEM